VVDDLMIYEILNEKREYSLPFHSLLFIYFLHCYSRALLFTYCICRAAG
jgi:hypothetical protein